MMNEQVKRLKVLASEQQRLIKELERENQRLKTLTSTLSNRIQDLENTNLMIDSEISEKPIDFDIIPGSDPNKH